MMKAVQAIVLASSVLTVGFSIGVPALSQDKQSVSRGFDYWQPDWMVRELWGGGRMPKGMMGSRPSAISSLESRFSTARDVLAGELLLPLPLGRHDPQSPLA